MTNDQRELVERLRNRHLLGDCQEAATTIEQLADRCGRLEAALRDISKGAKRYWREGEDAYQFAILADAALKEGT